MLIPVLIGITLCIFLIMHMLPGDAISSMLGIEETPEARQRLEEQFGLDLPWYKQYWNWISRVLQGDFGNSLRTDKPILPEMLS